MSEPKRLMPETLEENLAFVRAAVGPGLTDEIQGHIAALEGEIRATRAACWEAVQWDLRAAGWSEADHFWVFVKDAIEEAKP